MLGNPRPVRRPIQNTSLVNTLTNEYLCRNAKLMYPVSMLAHPWCCVLQLILRNEVYRKMAFARVTHRLGDLLLVSELTNHYDVCSGSVSIPVIYGGNTTAQ